MGLGMAVIASDFPKWRNILDSEKCGLLVDPENVEDIKNAIEFMYYNYEKTVQMGLNGRKAILNKYNWNIEEIKLFNFYEKIIKE